MNLYQIIYYCPINLNETGIYIKNLYASNLLDAKTKFNNSLNPDNDYRIRIKLIKQI